MAGILRAFAADSRLRNKVENRLFHLSDISGKATTFPLVLVWSQVTLRAIVQSHLAAFNYENRLNVGNNEDETRHHDSEQE